MKRHSQFSGILISSSMLLLAPQAVWSATPASPSATLSSDVTVTEIAPSNPIDAARIVSTSKAETSVVASGIAELLPENVSSTSETVKITASTLNLKDNALKLSALPEFKSAFPANPPQRIAQSGSPEVLFPNAQVSVERLPSAGSPAGIPTLNGGGLPQSSSVQILNTGGGARPVLPTLGQSNGIPNGGVNLNGVTPTNLPRAVPPPVGDISISNFGPNFGSIDLGTTQRLPRLILREAPVREVLSLLARSAGMNVVFTNEAPAKDPTAAPAAPTSPEGPRISLDIENESVQDVFNYVLRVGGLQANRSGRTIFVGTRLPVEAQNIIVRTLRLNQVNSLVASTYLSTFGAETRQFFQGTKIVTDGVGATARRTEEVQPPQVINIPVTEGRGPLPLLGLSVTADPRLNTITFLGDPQKIAIATNLITQLDARKRQVLVNVKIVDVNLNNIKTQNSSFSFRVGQNTFSVDNGAALYNFGPSRPPTNTETRNSIVFPVITGLPALTGETGFFDNNPNALQSQIGTTTSLGSGQFFSRAPFGTQTNPFQPGVTQVQAGQVTLGQPSLYQFPSQLLTQLQAQIVSRNAKILTDPSLVVQEGERAKVALTQQVIGNVTSTTTSDGNLSTRTVTANIVNAGLELNVNVERIDDNGFITLTVNPQITSLGASPNLALDNGAVNTIQLLNTRSVESGRIRLRDGQTLILSGIIQDSDQTDITKVPILGDLPILGTLFRRTGKTNARQEVIVLLTPQILDDSDRANFGYGYNSPSNEVQKALSGR